MTTASTQSFTLDNATLTSIQQSGIFKSPVFIVKFLTEEGKVYRHLADKDINKLSKTLFQMDLSKVKNIQMSVNYNMVDIGNINLKSKGSNVFESFLIEVENLKGYTILLDSKKLVEICPSKHHILKVNDEAKVTKFKNKEELKEHIKTNLLAAA